VYVSKQVIQGDFAPYTFFRALWCPHMPVVCGVDAEARPNWSPRDSSSRHRRLQKERPTSTLTFPLGPFHPALAQPFALTLRLRGETVAGVEPPVTGYCQRGVTELAEGRPLDDVLALVERSCALAGTTHRTALCMAVESAANVTPGKMVRVARVLFAEVERILARLWLLAEAGRAANVPLAVADALAQREMLLEATETITGERTFWGIAVPGGVRPDLGMKPLRDAFERFESSAASWRRMVSPQGSLGRGQRCGDIYC
jgi:Ni,Fe-hydrogenase III large subunit